MEESHVSQENAAQSPTDITVDLDTDPLHSFQLARKSLIGKILADKPLNRGAVRRVWVPKIDLPRIWIIFRYEKLQNLCFNCGIIGHEQKSCSKQKVMSPLNPNLPRFSAKLSVPPAKSILSIAHDQRFWKHKGPGSSPPVPRNSSSSQGGNADMDTNLGPDDHSHNKGVQRMTSHPGTRVLGEVASGSLLQKEKEKAAKDNVPPLGRDKARQRRNSSTHYQQNQSTSAKVISDFVLPGPHAPTPLPPTQSATEQVSFANYKTLNLLSNPPGIGPQGPSLTKIDLHQLKIRPGLGPEHLEDLGIDVEFIGLSKDTIIIDYPSPNSDKYQGANLSASEIKKCRHFIERKQSSCSQKSSDLGYREDDFVDATHLFDDLWAHQKRLKILNEDAANYQFAPLMQTSILGDPSQAEEAGLNLPHQQP
ncbi:Zinc finger, CCHC-type [Sesbania bispinosa]|nr:Zinc finger, CCHC-type [Sesbania bispinosa]